MPRKKEKMMTDKELEKEKMRIQSEIERLNEIERIMEEEKKIKEMKPSERVMSNEMKDKLKRFIDLGENIGDFPEKVDMGGVDYIREDLADKPREITERFLMRKQRKKVKVWNPFTWHRVIFSGGEKLFEPKGNLLFLLDNEAGIKIYDNVKSGIFRLKQYEGTTNERENYLILKPNKLRTIRFEEEDPHSEEFKKDFHWRGWVADINGVNALPQEPMYDTEDVGQLIRRAVSDSQSFEQPKKASKWGKYLKYGAIGLIICYIIYLGITKYNIGDWGLLGLILLANCPLFIVGNNLICFKRMELLQRHGIRKISELDLSEIILGVYKELEGIAIGDRKVDPDVVLSVTKRVIREKGFIGSMIAESEIASACRGLLGLLHNINKDSKRIKKEEFKEEADDELIEELKLKIKKYKKELDAGIGEQKRLAKIYQEYITIK